MSQPRPSVDTPANYVPFPSGTETEVNSVVIPNGCMVTIFEDGGDNDGVTIRVVVGDGQTPGGIKLPTLAELDAVEEAHNDFSTTTNATLQSHATNLGLLNDSAGSAATAIASLTTGLGDAQDAIDAAGDAISMVESGTAANAAAIAANVTELGRLAQLDATNKEPNLADNPAMAISQEHGDTALTTSGQYPADCIFCAANAPVGVTVTHQRVDSTGTCEKAVRITITNATAITASSFVGFDKRIHAPEFKRLKWGTPDARPLKLGIDLDVSEPGDYAVVFRNAAGDRSYVAGVNIASGEEGSPVRKFISVPGDTSGSWLTGERQVGLIVSAYAAVGSDYVGVAGAWQAGNKLTFAGAKELVSTEGATFAVTAYDLYADDYDIDREFQHKTYDESLWDCQKWCCWRERGASNYSTGGTKYSAYVLEVITHPRQMPRFNGVIVDTNATAIDWDIGSNYTVTGNLTASRVSAEEIQLSLPVTGGSAGDNSGLANYKIFVDGRL